MPNHANLSNKDKSPNAELSKLNEFKAQYIAELSQYLRKHRNEKLKYESWSINRFD